MINKDFLKQVFAEQKTLLKRAELRTIVTPKFAEISVKNIFPKIQADPLLMKYFPDALPKGREPDREYTFNVLNTLRPSYMQDIIRHAQTVRTSATEDENMGETILISKDWQAQLEEVPFISSKFLACLRPV